MELIIHKVEVFAINHPIAWWLFLSLLFTICLILSVCFAVSVVILVVCCFKLMFVDWAGAFKAFLLAGFFLWLTFVLIELAGLCYPGPV